MSMEIVMPKTGLTNTENALDKWQVSEGEQVKKGQVLAEIESEKTTMPFESPEDGIIHLVAGEGDTVPVGGVIAHLAADQAEYESLCAAAAPAVPAAPAAAVSAAAVQAESVLMPKTGLTNTENTLDQWQVSEGEQVKKGQVLAEIESEKTTMPFESPADGKIHLVAGEGDTVPVGGVIAYLAADEAQYQAVCTASAAPQAAPGGRIIASPLARKKAEKAGIDLSLITGTGPGGRIVARDVDSCQPAVQSAAGAKSREPVRIPLTPIRKAIARNMFNSLHTMAQTSDSVEVDVTELAAMRRRLVENEKLLGTRVTLNDLLSYAAVKMLKTHPLANASYTDQEILTFPYVNLSVAVATDYGLTSPVVRDADQMSLVELSRALREIVVKAREKRLTADDQRDGTFTLTNMGVFPVDNFNPILPAPQSCIMGFGRAVEKPVVYQGQICVRTMMCLSVTYDHRVFDGGEIGSILKTMKEYLETPELFLAQ